MNKGKLIILVAGKGDYIKSTKLKKILLILTKNEVTKTILGTTAVLVTNLAKGELLTSEGLVYTGRYIDT